MEAELNMLRLTKIKKEREEIKNLKNKYEIFDINRFSLSEPLQIRYQRNISIIRKLVKTLPKRHFLLYTKNVDRIKNEVRINDIVYINMICKEYKIPADIINIIISYL